ncbi:MAG: hypothetical protein IJ188_09000 [Clostridia bacterium]|nr:hypothetical protein [Clostridia bacterium]
MNLTVYNKKRNGGFAFPNYAILVVDSFRKIGYDGFEAEMNGIFWKKHVFFGRGELDEFYRFAGYGATTGVAMRH